MFEIEEGRKIHIVGVGGIGMSALADIFLQKGYRVSGSDGVKNQNVERLIPQGLIFFNEHKETNIEGASVVVYSSAIKDDNSERVAARQRGIPEVHRGKMVSMLLNEAFGLAVSGAHGKTTTTSILTSLFINLGLAPSAIVGGIVKEVGTNAVFGQGKYFIAEADESDGSFLNFFPEIAIITNIDEDHLDFYKTLENIKRSFLNFSKQISSEGLLVLNCDDLNSKDLIENSKSYKTFGLSDKADYRATNIVNHEGGCEFELVYLKQKFQVKTSLSGEHNIANILAAIIATHTVYPNLTKICEAVERFEGASRRFDVLLDSQELVVIDDYAHHPTEIKAVLSSVRARFSKRRLIVLFEPHRFSRTQDFWSEFVADFSVLSEVYISDIYSAGESSIEGVSSRRLIEEVNDVAKKDIAIHMGSWSELQKIFSKSKNEPVVILSLGAGSISIKVREQVEKWIKS